MFILLSCMFRNFEQCTYQWKCDVTVFLCVCKSGSVEKCDEFFPMICFQSQKWYLVWQAWSMDLIHNSTLHFQHWNFVLNFTVVDEMQIHCCCFTLAGQCLLFHISIQIIQRSQKEKIFLMCDLYTGLSLFFVDFFL